MTYRRLDNDTNLFFKTDSVTSLRRIDKLIFDFDGVLIRQLYSRAIRRVVDYYFLEILGLEGENGKLVTWEDIQTFKDTGMFNNDWTLTYTLIQYYLETSIKSLSPSKLRNFVRYFGNCQLTELPSFIRTLREVGAFLTDCRVTVDQLVDTKTDKTAGIDAFLTGFSKEMGAAKLESLLTRSSVETDQLTIARTLVPYDFEKPDLLKRLFEELYLGKKLFSRFYATPSYFDFSESLLEQETLIPTQETLKSLHQKLGKHAIYSERPREQGLYLFEKHGLVKYFNKEQLIFLEDMFLGNTRDEHVLLNKPNPTFLLELIAKHTGEPVEVAYVGDGVADALLVENARLKGLSNLWFIGVLSSTRYPNKLVSTYKTLKAAAIMDDVNTLPHLLDSLGGTT